MGLYNLFGGSLGSLLVQEEVSGWLALIVFHFDGVVLDHRSHEGIVSLLTESFRQGSLVAASRSVLGFPSSEVFDLTDLDIFLIVRVGVRINVHIVPSLNLSPVIVEVAGEGGIWMSIFWHWTSNIWLWILLNTSLNLSPVIVEVARESGVWVSVLWHWASDVWLRVFLASQLKLGPVVVEMG